MDELLENWDEESLRAWLGTLSAQDALLIAHRAAMRAALLGFTGIEQFTAPQRDVGLLLILRLNLLVGVACKYPLPESKLASFSDTLDTLNAGASYAAATDIAATLADSGGTRGALVAAIDALCAVSSVPSRSPSRDGTRAALDALEVIDARNIARAVLDALIPDSRALAAKADLLRLPLWPMGNPLEHEWERAKSVLRAAPGGEFWVDWYQRALDGREQNWPLIQDIALINDELWLKSGEWLDAEINRIVGEHAEGPDEVIITASDLIPLERLLRAAIADFRFDQIENLMRMVPFAEDLRHLSDPEILARFLADTADMTRSLRTLCRAISAEAGHLQGAGWISVYLDEVLNELSHAQDVRSLNVGVIVEYCAILQGGTNRKEIEDELASLAVPLKANIEKLRALTIAYFAHTFVREAPLKEIRSDPQTPLTDLLNDIRRALSAVKDTDPTMRVPLAQPDIEIFEALIAELDRRIRAEFIASTPDIKGRLRQEVDFLMAKTALSLVLYAEGARDALKKVERVAGFTGTLARGIGGLEALMEFLKRIFSPAV